MIYHFGEFAGNDTWKNATFVASLALTNVTDRFLSRYGTILSYFYTLLPKHLYLIATNFKI